MFTSEINFNAHQCKLNVNIEEKSLNEVKTNKQKARLPEIEQE